MMEGRDKARARRDAMAAALWRAYFTERQEIHRRYKPYVNAVFRPNRGRPDVHQIQDSAEWKALGRALFVRRRQFDARERSLLGALGNAIRLHAATGARDVQVRRAGGLKRLFHLMVSGRLRRVAFDAQQEALKHGLRHRQRAARTRRAGVLEAARNAELAQAAERFEAKKAALRAAAQAERAQERVAWQTLDREREEQWAAWRVTFGIGSRPHAAQVQARQAQDAAQGHGPSGDGKDWGDGWTYRRQSGGAPASRAPSPSLPPGAEDSATPDPAARQAWKARRSAAQRKADGDYKPHGPRRPRPG
jgi:hypothetical protein